MDSSPHRDQAFLKLASVLARLEQAQRALEIYKGAAGRPMTADEHDALDALASSEGEER